MLQNYEESKLFTIYFTQSCSQFVHSISQNRGGVTYSKIARYEKLQKTGKREFTIRKN